MVQEWKTKKVREITDVIEKSPVVGMLDLHGLGAAQLQKMRKDTRGKAKIIVTKKTIIKRAIESSKKENIKNLEKYESHIPALIISDDNSFRLYRQIENSKTPAYAKAGQISPKDIVVPAGETSLPPGPVISDLQKAGIKAMIQGDKIAIREDSPLLKEGEEISEIKANVMMKLGIKPMEVGLNLLGTHEKNIVLDKSLLSINTQEYITKIQTAYTQSLNLAYNASIFIKEIMPQKLAEAHSKAINLAIEAEIENKETINILIQKANAEAQSLALKLPEDIKAGKESKEEAPKEDEKPAEEKSQEEAKPEEKKKEETLKDEPPAEEKEEVKEPETKEEPKKEDKEEKKPEKEEKPKSDEESAGGLGALFG